MTKQEIQNKINQLKRQQDIYVKEKNAYIKSLDRAEELVSRLLDSSNNIHTSSEHLRNYFTIRGEYVGSKEITTIDDGVISIKSELTKEIIPAINNSIKTLTNKIYTIENQIESLKRQLASATE